MVIPRTFIAKDVIPTPEGWQVTVWRRPRETIFSKPHYHYFPTEEEAREYLRSVWREGNLTEEGRKAKFTTKAVWWVSDDLVLTRPYTGLPSVTSTVQDGLLKVWVDGVQIAEAKATKSTPVQGLKAQIASHPLGECLLARVCYRCRRLPRINPIEGTLTHLHKDCLNKFKLIADPLTPPTVQIAVWNKELADRFMPATAKPVLRPDFMVLGVMKYPSDLERIKKISKIESLSFDK